MSIGKWSVFHSVQNKKKCFHQLLPCEIISLIEIGQFLLARKFHSPFWDNFRACENFIGTTVLISGRLNFFIVRLGAVLAREIISSKETSQFLPVKLLHSTGRLNFDLLNYYNHNFKTIFIYKINFLLQYYFSVFVVLEKFEFLFSKFLRK